MSRLSAVFIHLAFVSGIFLLAGCDVTDDENQTKTNFTGKWRLLNSSDSSDAPYLHSSWILLGDDSHFQSNTSFFWRGDSLGITPLTGTWSVEIDKDLSTVLFDKSGKTSVIQLKVDSTAKRWVIGGNGTKDSTMLWYRDDMEWQYSWTLSN